MELSTLIFIIFTIAISVIVINIWKSKYQAKKSAEVLNPEPIQTESQLKKSMNSLLDIEIMLAIDGPEYVRDITRPLFDILYDIMEVLNNEYVGLSYELNNMAQEVLPNRIASFIKVEDGIDIFKTDIGTMLRVVTDIQNIIKNDNISKNEREALLIKIKY